ncbi:MAG: hypothetical protein WAK17_25775 [Candidatus Nitrosopolaris sp.]
MYKSQTSLMLRLIERTGAEDFGITNGFSILLLVSFISNGDRADASRGA